MTPELIALLAGPMFLVPLAGYALSRRGVRGASWYGVLLLAIAAWSLAYAWELLATSLAMKTIALKVKYLGVLALPPAWIGFILSFVGGDSITVRRRVRPLVAVAAVLLLVAWTDGWHGWFWGSMRVADIGDYHVLQGRGPVFWINILYTYAALATGIVLLLAHTVHSPYLYRRRAEILMLGTLLPWAGNLVFVLRHDETIFDPTPFLFTCTALIAALAVFRYDLFEPVPTLRDARIGSVGDGVIVLDLQRRIADLNASAEAVIARRRSEAAGSIIDVLLPGWPPGALPTAPLDITLQHGGERRTYDVRCSPVRSRAGQETGSVVILRDVTERRVAEAALRESEQRYRTVIEQAFDGVLLTDTAGRIVDANPQACAMLEYAAGDLRGRHLADLGGRADGTWWLPGAPATGPVPAVAWEREFSTRAQRTVLLSGRSRQIGPDLVVSTFRDVTEERAQAQLRERLLEEALAAARLKDEFLATLSHELRTPLNAVVGWTHMLINQQLDPARVPHALAVIERNTQAQVRLVEDLLDLSRLSGGRARLVLREADLAVLALEALEAVAPSAIARRITLHAELPSELPTLVADADRVRQAIWNLLTNAIKFTPAHGRVAIGAHATPDEVTVWVNDTGQGIAADFLPHVFEPFRQADSGTTRSVHGLGLGLAIVHRIVEAHGGRVEAESAGPGAGATFRLRLPRLPPESAADTSAPAVDAR